jgi:hypothetical protein
MANNIEILKPEPEKEKIINENFDKDTKPKGWKKWLFIITAILSGIYVFIPEVSDAFPIIGWLDEGLAIIIFTYSINKLGIKIPYIDKFLHKKTIKTNKIIKNQS